MARKQFSIKTALKDSGDLALSGLDPWQDGLTYNPYPLETANLELLFNGANWDRKRNNTQGTLLASSARTTATISPTIINHNCKGVIIWLKVTSASGTGGLIVRIGGFDNSGQNYWLNASPTPITASGYKAYILYPGASTAGADVAQATSNPLPRTWNVTVQVGDSSSYTYEVDYSLIY
ncbi:MAG: hypothetical protein Q8906_05975 [Bacillota bacterium]|nr:hypothetical protein [Bacillota bacterium]